VIFEISGEMALSYLDGNSRPKIVNRKERNIICLAHPGILMKPGVNNSWPERFEKEITVNTRNSVKEIVGF